LEAAKVRTFRPKNHVEWLKAAFLTDKRVGSSAELISDARAVQLRLLARIPVVIILGLIVAFVGVATTFQVVALISAGLVVYRWWHQRPVSLKTIAVVLASVIVLYVLTFVFHSRLLAVGLMALGTLALFVWTGKRPAAFVEEMMHADVLPEERANYPRDPKLRPSWWVLLVMLAIVVFVPWLHSASFGILLLCLFCGALLVAYAARSGSPVQTLSMTWRAMSRMLTDYMTYPDADRGSLEWQSREYLGERRRTFNRLWMSLTLVLAVGLSYCIPWEFFGAHFQPGFSWSVPPTSNAVGFGWLTRPFTMALSASSDYRWALIIGLVLSLALPYLMLFVVYFPAIQKLHRLLWDVRSEKAADTRTEFERDQERLAQSEHVETN
jgi:hypothetical protein